MSVAASWILLGIIAPSVVAADVEPLLNDATKLQDALDREVIEGQWDSADDQEFSSLELLPGEELSEEEEDENDSPYVEIVIDGRLVPLTDVPRDQWFAPYVRAVAEEGLISGYRSEAGDPLGLYGPADSVTIEQLAKITVLASETEIVECGATTLNPGAAGRWSEQYVRCAEAMQWAVFADGTIDLLKPATRAQVIVTVLQAFGVEFVSTDAAPFADVDSSTEFRSAIVRAYSDSIISGYSDSGGNPTGMFGPQHPVNRAELAKIVTLAIETYR